MVGEYRLNITRNRVVEKVSGNISDLDFFVWVDTVLMSIFRDSTAQILADEKLGLLRYVEWAQVRIIMHGENGSRIGPIFVQFGVARQG